MLRARVATRDSDGACPRTAVLSVDESEAQPETILAYIPADARQS